MDVVVPVGVQRTVAGRMGDLVTGQLLLRSMSCCNLVYPYVEIKTRDVINGQYEGKINNSVLIDRIPLLIMDILILFLD